MSKTVALLFGGKSAEHEISVRSAKNVCEALDKNKFQPVLIGISKSGTWYLIKNLESLQKLSAVHDNQLPSDSEQLSFSIEKDKPIFISLKSQQKLNIDIAFPILHGTFGEDGTIQGLFKMLNLPFVGCGVLASSLGMDKDAMKRVFTSEGLQNSPWVLLRAGQANDYNSLVGQLGSPFFIKPANAGSSVGVHKIKSKEDFDKGLKDAFLYDSKVLAEKFIKGREIECAVLGRSTNPKASIPGEVVPTHDFYSYEAKYLDDNGAKIVIPAKLTEKEISKIQSLARKAFTALGCEGLTRVDFFLTESGEVFINEVNTIPGFTNISMYPKMWEASGLGYRDLITQLIELGLDVHKDEMKIQTNYLDLGQ